MRSALSPCGLTGVAHVFGVSAAPWVQHSSRHNGTSAVFEVRAERGPRAMDSRGPRPGVRALARRRRVRGRPVSSRDGLKSGGAGSSRVVGLCCCSEPSLRLLLHSSGPAGEPSGPRTTMSVRDQWRASSTAAAKRRRQLPGRSESERAGACGRTTCLGRRLPDENGRRTRPKLGKSSIRSYLWSEVGPTYGQCSTPSRAGDPCHRSKRRLPSVEHRPLSRPSAVGQGYGSKMPGSLHNSAGKPHFTRSAPFSANVPMCGALLAALPESNLSGVLSVLSMFYHGRSRWIVGGRPGVARWSGRDLRDSARNGGRWRLGFGPHVVLSASDSGAASRSRRWAELSQIGSGPPEPASAPAASHSACSVAHARTMSEA